MYHVTLPANWRSFFILRIAYSSLPESHDMLFEGRD